MELGYCWNSTKCVMVNSPTIYGAPPLRLYGDPIPIADSFSYLGIPFESKDATDQLLKYNIVSALPAMRNTLQPMGLRAPSFSRLTVSRLYAIFIRPKLEYGLCLCLFTMTNLKLLGKAQDQYLRLAFGGHRTASTTVFRHMTCLSAMHERAHTLVLKFILRTHFLLEDTLLHTIRS
ncbi:hypothetical protein RMATCC62417_16216 [Rhizopus microsporus]|nr:hypothetical protein RMATCC62417_16216 [Rhizopus microsporus]